MSKTVGAKKNKKTARTGAAAFALGLFLAGPVSGVATADSGEDSSERSSSADAGSATRAKGAAERGAGQSAEAATSRAAGSARAVGRGSTRQPGSAAATRTSRAAGSAAARSVRSADSETLGVFSAAPAVASPSAAVSEPAPVVSEPQPPVADESVSASWVASSAANQRVSVAIAPKQMAPVWAKAAPERAISVAAARLNTKVNSLFHTLADVLAALPAGNLQTNLEGALLMVRRNFFNQAPVATPVQLTTTSEGLVLGTIAGRDPEGDAVTYSVLTNPQYGTVAINADGHYTYTPGSNYAGSDNFTVQVACETKGSNLLGRGNHGSTAVQVGVGDQAATTPFTGAANHQDPVDATLRLSSASARITVSKEMGRFTATVALTNVTPETQLMWMDATGRTGQVSVAEMASTHWGEYASAAEAAGGGVTLGVVYTGTDGTDQAVILADAHATQNPDGQIVFSGNLARDAKSNTGYTDDFWDTIGTEYKSAYENFRQQYVEVKNFSQATFEVSGANVYADTYSVGDYKAAMDTGNDTGVRLGETSGVTAAAAKLTGAFSRQVTATLSDPKGLIVGLADGSVKQWNGTAWQSLGSPSGSAVRAVANLPDGLTVVYDREVAQWNGTDWKKAVLNIPFKGSVTVQKVVPTDKGLMIAVGNGDASALYELRSGSISGSTGNIDSDARFESPLVAAIPYQGGLVVALRDGTVQQTIPFSVKWKTLRDDSGSLNTYVVTAMAPFRNGFVIANDEKEVWQFDGTNWIDIGSKNNSDLDKRRTGPGYDSVITSLMEYNGLLVAGLDNGAVSLYSNDLWGDSKLPAGSGPVKALLPYGNGFVSAWENGTVAQWSNYSWSDLQAPGSGTFTSLSLDGNGGLVLSQNANSRGYVGVYTPGKGWQQPDGSWRPFSASLLKKAVAFGQTDSKQIATAADPLFGLAQYQPACVAAKKCRGEFYQFALAYEPSSLAKQEWALNLGTNTWETVNKVPGDGKEYGPSVDLSYDAGGTTYGYLFVPDGMWDKTSSDKYSAGVLFSLTSGPSLNLNVAVEKGKSDPIKITDIPLIAAPLYTSPPSIYGNVQISAGVNAGIEGTLDLPKDFSKDKLSASAYFTPGMLMTFNTAGDPGIGFGFNYYYDVDYKDFTSIEGVTISPTLTPYAKIDYGLIAPAGTPIVAGKSLFKIGVGYANPVAANFAFAKDTDPSVTLSSTGKVTFSAGILDFWTDSLTYNTDVTVYKAETDNLLAAGTKV